MSYLATWETKDGDVLLVREMETSHIQNCIRMLERTMPDFEDDIVEVADHWSTMGVYQAVGAKSYRAKIRAFKKELAKRFHETLPRHNASKLANDTDAKSRMERK